ncbi:hypothetical protein RFI_11001 [Reticulomyxa filosa]|uniref:Uncharacterized protein n=1 Tax=Reticulomyxa filosa TaxID=46433 RepID=X6NJG1_RETFI|nr:hypothetical protein RFI_11001 [Reticulomyxa filosa]|eukprot:ETO26136.1 hypothetical protein RFI_11001 [Reticulomyxa filosa]
MGLLIYEPSRKERRRMRQQEQQRRKRDSNIRLSTDAGSDGDGERDSDIDYYESEEEEESISNTTLGVESFGDGTTAYFRNQPPNTLNMNNQTFMAQIPPSYRSLLQSVIARAIADCKTLKFIKMCNALVDDAFLEKICNELISQRAKDSSITELWLDLNSIGDAGMMSLSQFILSNNRITIMKLQQNKCVISNNVCEGLLKALEMNHSIIKFEFDFKLIQHRDKLQKIMWRNWGHLHQQRMQRKKQQMRPQSSSAILGPRHDSSVTVQHKSAASFSTIEIDNATHSIHALLPNRSRRQSKSNLVNAMTSARSQQGNAVGYSRNNTVITNQSPLTNSDL